MTNVLTVWKTGHAQTGSCESINKNDKVELEWNGEAFLVTPVGEGVFVVRGGIDTIVTIIVFKDNLKPRVFNLHDVPFVSSKAFLIKIIFERLLDFDDNRLSNRDRNCAIVVIRQSLPNFVRGRFGSGDYRYNLYSSLLTVHGNNEAVVRVSYDSFSRNIKGKLQ